MLSASHSILETTGNTPVFELKKMAAANRARIFAKYEANNPSCSLKDRLALRLIEKFEKCGRLNRGSLVVAATGGNTGLALALACAVRRYRLHLFMPSDVSPEKRDLFDTFGAAVHVTPSEFGVGGARTMALDFAAMRQKAVLLDQYGDDTVVKAHEETTAGEILKDFPRGVDAFVMGIGSAATMMGVGGVLKKNNSRTLLIAVDPESNAVLSGGMPGQSHIQQLGLGFVPRHFKRSLIDRFIRISDATAYERTKELALSEGILAGLSTGANLEAACQIADELGPEKSVLTIICDQGQRYFSLKGYFTP